MQGLSSKSDSMFDLASALSVLVHDMGTQQVGSQTLYSVSKQALFTDAIDERPQDSERVWLPTAQEDFPSRCKCLLSDVPTAPSCSVLVFDLDDTQMWVCQIGASKWDSCDYTITVPDAQDNPQKRHIARRNGIAAVGFPAFWPLCSTYLVGSCNELFLVDVIFDGENVHKIAELVVFKMDFSEPAWHKVDRIGDDRAFLLGGDRIGVSNFGASCMATPENGLWANSIYFLNHLAITENYLHVFSLDKGTEQVQRPFWDMGFDMPVRSPFWILPTNP
ncbi:hypothetical protein BS78_09G040600 [Paspalum vaginatum]|nr:hypothetical protein BS78_09G040600 [Paspalum vaginatum]